MKTFYIKTDLPIPCPGRSQKQTNINKA